MNKNEVEWIEVVSSRGQVSALIWKGVLMEQNVRVAGGHADIDTGQLLIIKHCLCPIVFCNYKCFNIGLFPQIVLPFFIVLSQIDKFPACWRSLSPSCRINWFSSLSHGNFTDSFTVGVITRDKGKWLPGYFSAFVLIQQIIILSATINCNFSFSSLCSEFRKCVIVRFISKFRMCYLQNTAGRQTACQISSKMKSSDEFSRSLPWQFFLKVSRASVRFEETVSVTATLLS